MLYEIKTISRKFTVIHLGGRREKRQERTGIVCYSNRGVPVLCLSLNLSLSVFLPVWIPPSVLSLSTCPSQTPASWYPLLHFAHGFHIGTWENLILWKGTNKSLQAPKCLWEHILSLHTVIDVEIQMRLFYVFLHCAINLQRNMQTKKNYFKRHIKTFHSDFAGKYTLLCSAVVTKETITITRCEVFILKLSIGHKNKCKTTSFYLSTSSVC